MRQDRTNKLWASTPHCNHLAIYFHIQKSCLEYGIKKKLSQIPFVKSGGCECFNTWRFQIVENTEELQLMCVQSETPSIRKRLDYTQWHPSINNFMILDYASAGGPRNTWSLIMVDQTDYFELDTHHASPIGICMVLDCMQQNGCKR